MMSDTNRLESWIGAHHQELPLQEKLLFSITELFLPSYYWSSTFIFRWWWQKEKEENNTFGLLFTMNIMRIHLPSSCIPLLACCSADCAFFHLQMRLLFQLFEYDPSPFLSYILATYCLTSWLSHQVSWELVICFAFFLFLMPWCQNQVVSRDETFSFVSMTFFLSTGFVGRLQEFLEGRERHPRLTKRKSKCVFYDIFLCIWWF